jgi:hypothetical protein
MNKNVWHSPAIPPSDYRNVLVKAVGYEDPFAANYFNGKWRADFDFESDYASFLDFDFEVEAWREIPTYEEPCLMTFRTAEEARYLSRQTISLAERGQYDKDFFEVRTLIIKATTTPNVWSVNIGIRPKKILEQLEILGFKISRQEDGTTVISWGKKNK